MLWKMIKCEDGGSLRMHCGSCCRVQADAPEVLAGEPKLSAQVAGPYAWPRGCHKRNGEKAIELWGRVGGGGGGRAPPPPPSPIPQPREAHACTRLRRAGRATSVDCALMTQKHLPGLVVARQVCWGGGILRAHAWSRGLLAHALAGLRQERILEQLGVNGPGSRGLHPLRRCLHKLLPLQPLGIHLSAGRRGALGVLGSLGGGMAGRRGHERGGGVARRRQGHSLVMGGATACRGVEHGLRGGWKVQGMRLGAWCPLEGPGVGYLQGHDTFRGSGGFPDRRLEDTGHATGALLRCLGVKTPARPQQHLPKGVWDCLTGKQQV